MIRAFKDRVPRIDKTVFVAESAEVIGDVWIGELSSVWYQTVIRGDMHRIRIGDRTNIQDLCMLHVHFEKAPVHIGSDVTVGHHVVLHGCTIADHVLIGMGSIVMDDVVIGEDSIIGAGALVTQSTVIPPGSIVLGAPAKVQREVRQKDLDLIREASQRYVDFSRVYLEAQDRDSS